MYFGYIDVLVSMLHLYYYYYSKSDNALIPFVIVVTSITELFMILE